MRGDADALGQRRAALLVVHGLVARALERHHGAEHRLDVWQVLQSDAATMCAGGRRHPGERYVCVLSAPNATLLRDGAGEDAQLRAKS